MQDLIVEYVVNKLNRLLRAASSLQRVRDDVEWVVKELRELMFFSDANFKHNWSDDERLREWERDVRNVAYDIEDAIDTFILQLNRPVSYKIYRYVCILMIRIKIDKIKSGIREISKRRIQHGLGNQSGIVGWQRSSLSNFSAFQPHHHNHHDLPAVVGFEGYERRIIEQLLNCKDMELRLISVYGVGGIGKTTLARQIYCNNEVKKHFETCIWVPVCKESSVRKLLKRMIAGVVGVSESTDLDDSGAEEEELTLELHELLKGLGRCLIVLDDVWETDLWKQIQTALPSVGRGSKVLITTRLEDVARLAGSAFAHHIDPLDQRQSRQLFLRRANLDGSVKELDEDLEEWAAEFVIASKGLPLALAVLGGLVSTKRASFSRSLFGMLRYKLSWLRMGNQCSDILRLCFEELPYNLKPCFLYIGSYPKEGEISAGKLMRLWIAEGFIPQVQGQTKEETAEIVLEELAQRCMVQVVDRRLDGRLKKVGIHEVLHDFCIEEGRQIGFLNTSDSDTSRVVTTRCLALRNHTGKWIDPREVNLRLQKLRTLLGCGLISQRKVGRYFNGLKFLRVIHLEGSFGLQTLPEEIIGLRLLMYLRLVDVTRLLIPSSIKNLQNLQIFDIRNGARLEESSASPGKTFAHLKSLQVLRCISAGAWIGIDLAELSKLQKLGIQDIRDSHKNALLGSLEKSNNLESLSLSSNESIDEEVLRALTNQQRLHKLYLDGPISTLKLPSNSDFPQHLTQISLEYTKLEKDPMEVLEKLSELVYLKLWNNAYVGKSMICSQNGFPKLQHLIFDALANLETWTLNAGSMPRLTRLAICRCRALNRLPLGLKFLTTLQEVRLLYMSRELKERIQDDKGADWYKIQHVPSFIKNNL